MKNKKLHERIITGILLTGISLAVYAGQGVETASGSGESRGEACARAKEAAGIRAGMWGTVTGYSACECGSKKYSDGSELWTCTAEAYWENK